VGTDRPGVSLDEDVAGVATMAVVAPVAAVMIAGILLAIGIVALVMLWTRVRRGWIRFRDWRGRRAAPV
jgi:hypothetical protein